MARPVLLLVLLPLWIGACRASPQSTPQFEKRTPEGVIYSDSEHDLDVLASALVELSPKVRALIGENRGVRPKIKMLSGSLPGRCLGLNQDDIIVISGNARDSIRFVLAHELVHWYARGAWSRLPHAMNEGLAELIACDLNPDRAGMRQLTHLISLRSGWVTSVHDFLQMTAEDWLAEEHRYIKDSWYAVAHLLASRVGVQGLRDLCERARNSGHERIPGEWIFTAADLSPDDIRKWPVTIHFRTQPSGSVTTLTVDPEE